MLPYRSRFAVPFVLAIAAFGVAPACNSMLDNRVGVLADGGVTDPTTATPGTEPEPGTEGNASSGGGSGTSGSSSSGGSSSGATGSGGTPTAPPPDAGGAGDAAVDAGAPAVDAGPLLDAGAPDAALVCPPGFADCDHEAANGCEAELASDRHNCGECGSFCLIGKCREGVCRL